MGRVVKNWQAVRVEDATVAPHRYLWDGTIRAADGEKATDMALCKGYDEAKANLPYVDGEVVYVDRGGKAVKALIYVAFVSSRDRFGDRVESYKVQVETAEGVFSKLWEMAHPGYIQRGYQRAGLAPDVDRWSPLPKPRSA